MFRCVLCRGMGINPNLIATTSYGREYISRRAFSWWLMEPQPPESTCPCRGKLLEQGLAQPAKISLVHAGRWLCFALCDELSKVRELSISFYRGWDEYWLLERAMIKFECPGLHTPPSRFESDGSSESYFRRSYEGGSRIALQGTYKSWENVWDKEARCFWTVPYASAKHPANPRSLPWRMRYES